VDIKDAGHGIPLATCSTCERGGDVGRHGGIDVRVLNSRRDVCIVPSLIAKGNVPTI
jgi:hypothetical protein